MRRIDHPADRPVEITDLISGQFMSLTPETTAEEVFEWLCRPEVWGRDMEVCPALVEDARGWSERAVTPWAELDDSWAYSEHQHIALL